MESRHITRLFAGLFVLCLALFGGGFAGKHSTATASNPGHETVDAVFAGKIVVANRAGGTISVIDTATDTVIDTLALPGAAPEPMYVVYSHVGNRVFVGDRANNRVAVFDAEDFSVIDTVGAGAGVFHMWINPFNTQLWVNNDIDNSISVIHPYSLETLATIPIPADLVGQGGKPHDVILDTRFAYVTVVGLPGEDMLVKFCQRRFEEVGRVAAGKDPHVSLTLKNQLLYVPSQNVNAVKVFNRRTLEPVTDIPVPAAHGAGMPSSGKHFYTTNIAGGGTDGLVAIDTKTNAQVGAAVDTPHPVPHNIALIPSGRKLYVTHSGATADKVTVYSADKHNPVPVFVGEVTVGLNPFGLAFVP